MSIDYLENSRYLGKPVNFYLIEGGATAEGLDETKVGPFAFCDAETTFRFPWIVRKIRGVNTEVAFVPWPIKGTEVSQDGTLDKSDITVTMALGTPLDSMFLAYPPSQVVNMTMFQGHVGDELIPTNYPAKWLGRILTGSREQNELLLNCQPVSSSVKRPGLRRNYQVGCPHVLYGSQCKAKKAAATMSRRVASVSRNVISLTKSVGNIHNHFLGGLVEWHNATTDVREIRTISSMSGDGAMVTIRGIMRGLNPGDSVSLIKGCNRLMSGCNLHNNILNYGGQPFIPLENPLSSKNQFY